MTNKEDLATLKENISALTDNVATKADISDIKSEMEEHADTRASRFKTLCALILTAAAFIIILQLSLSIEIGELKNVITSTSSQH